MGTPNGGINGTLATGLIGHWDFTDGRLLDVSGSGNNLLRIGTGDTPATDKDGIANGCIKFNYGSALRESNPTIPLNGDISAVSWFYCDGSVDNRQQTIVWGTHVSADRYGVYYANGYINYYNGDAQQIAPAAVGWHCFIFTKEFVYLDNVKYNVSLPNLNRPADFCIGGKVRDINSAPLVTTDTLIDEVRLYNRNLTDSECQELYEMGVNYTPVTKCDTPTFSKAGGSYPQEPFNVSISTTTADADIYYTTDGSDPEETKTLYTEAVTINKTTTLKAIAIKTGFDNSDISSVQYNLSDTSFVKTKHNIRVLERDLTFVAEIDTYTSLTFQRNMYNAGRFTLMLNYYTTNALELTMNRLIMLDNNPYKVGIIKRVKYIQDGNNETLEVTGFELKGIFKQRVTIPDAGQSHQKFSTTNFETILKGLVQKQCVDNATMKFDRLEVVANTNKGFEFGFETRYKKLDEEIEKISRNAEIGYQVYLDFESKKWKFDIIRSNVILDENAFLPIFSSEYDNMERQEFETDTSESKNYAIVAGQGEGADRTIKIVHSETTTDIDLSVMFADARDINTDAELQERGTLKLAEAAATYSFDCDIIDDAPFVYEIDWDLGDMVQIVSKKMGVKITKLVEEVTEFYQVGSDRKINAVFGKATPGIRKYIDTTNDVGID